MESLQSFLKMISFFVWFGLFSVCCIQWCKGLVDGKSILKLFGIILAIGFGYEIVQIVISHRPSASENTFTCSQGVSGVFLNCAGWPIFSEKIAYLAEKTIQATNFIYAASNGYVQIITAIVIFSKFSRNIWTVDFKEILFAFAGGALIYVSLMYMAEIENSFMMMTQYLLGFEKNHGGQGNTIDEVVINLSKWQENIQSLIDVSKDKSIFSFSFGSASVSLLCMYLMYAIINFPLIWFSLLNVIMLFFQQLLLLSIPLDAIKMSMSMNIDPFMVIKKLFAISLLSTAVAAEFMILSWLPKPEQLGVFAGLNIPGGVYAGIFCGGIILIVIIGVVTIVSGFIIFKAFLTGKEAMDSALSKN